MTYAMCAHIIFPAVRDRGRVELRKVHAVELRMSINTVCQSASVLLPKNISVLQQEQLRTYIRRGDPVEVYLGYDGDLQLEFEGYVERMGAEIPVAIELRDRLWMLLQRSFDRSYKVANVRTVVSDLVDGAFAVEALDATIGPRRWSKSTVGKVLKELQDEFGLKSYLLGNTLRVGVPFSSSPVTVAYDEERNMRSSNLTYRLADDVKLQVVAESTKKNGTKISVQLGDADGERRTLSYYGIDSVEELRKLAEQDMQRFKYDGYEGSFSAFGVPYCTLGYRVQLRSRQYPERDGSYLAEGVTTSFGPEGFKREVKLAQGWTL